jgi:hypothetical protein
MKVISKIYLPGSLEVGEKCKVLMQTDYSILIRTSGGSEMWCSKASFYSEEEYREEKLNKILEDDSNI